MKYNSLFERFYPNADCTYLNYEKTLGELLNTFKALQPFGRLKIIDILVLFPPRIIRAVIDFKIENPNTQNIEELLQIVLDFSLNIYSQSYSDISKEVEKLEQYISRHFPSLLSYTIIQNEDTYTWLAMNPQKSYLLISNLIPIIQSKEILFIALGHGGIAVGMDVYLRVKPYISTSNFYVARLSTRKHFDSRPKLSPLEVQKLQKLAQNKIVIIFDEDSASGKTKQIAEEFFSNLFEKKVLFVSNMQPENVQNSIHLDNKNYYKK